LDPDEIAAELLEVGGCPMTVHLHCIIDVMVLSETWRVKWKGGRIERLYEIKGSPLICSNSRGLLISDRCSKAVVGLDDNYCVKTIEDHLLVSQFGGVIWRRRRFPEPYSTKLDSLCKDRKCSYSSFSLTVERPSKVIREVMGLPQCDDGRIDTSRQRIDYLISLGVDLEVASFISSHVGKHGAVLASLGIDARVAELIKSLRSSAWFKVGDVETQVATKRWTSGVQAGGYSIQLCLRACPVGC
jgi:hypothetical protein